MSSIIDENQQAPMGNTSGANAKFDTRQPVDDAVVNVGGASSRLASHFRPITATGTYGDIAPVKTMVDMFKQILESIPADDTNSRQSVFRDIHFNIVSPSLHSTIMPYVVVSYVTKTQGKKYASYHTLAMEVGLTRNLPRTPRNITQNNETHTYEYPIVSSDTYTTALRQSIIEPMLVETYKIDDVLDGGVTVIPRTADLTDMGYLESLLNKVCAAAYAPMGHLTQTMPRFDRSLLDETSRFSAEVTFYPEPQLDIHNTYPIRQDLTVTVKHTSKAGDINDPFIGSSVLNVSTLGAYIDLIFVDDPSGMAQNSSTPTGPYFQPKLNITNLGSDLGINSLELMLMSMSTAVIFQDQARWASVFRPKVMVGKTAMGKEINRDIGAIGYEVPTIDSETGQVVNGAMIDTTGSDFTAAELGRLIESYCPRSLLYCMDIPEEGPQTPILNVFLEAATEADRIGSSNQHRSAEEFAAMFPATAAIVSAANSLTNNAFSKYFDHYSTPIVKLMGNDRNFNGFYISDPDTGATADIREVDNYLTMLTTFGENNLPTVTAWDRTHTNEEILEARLSAREELVGAAIPTKFAITGFSRPVLFNANFLSGVAAALAETGIAPSTNNVAEFFGSSTRRSASSFSNFVNPDMTAPAEYYTSQDPRFGGSTAPSVNTGYWHNAATRSSV